MASILKFFSSVQSDILPFDKPALNELWCVVLHGHPILLLVCLIAILPLSAAAPKKAPVQGGPKKKKKSGAAKKFKKKTQSQKGSLPLLFDASRCTDTDSLRVLFSDDAKSGADKSSPQRQDFETASYDSAGEKGSGSEDDYSDDGDEGTEGYRPGGYHPVHVGDIFNFRYVVLQKLGWGHFSTVWMCLDRARKDGSPQYVAMKVQKSAPHYREAAFDEIELLSCVKKASSSEDYHSELDRGVAIENHKNVVILLDHFEHTGPNGRHVCMVFEMLGENLLSVIKKYEYKGIPIDIVRRYTLQICRGLDFLHRHASIIHTDLKPENILIAEPPPVPPEEFVKALVEMGPIKHMKSAAPSTNGGGSVTGKRKARKGKGKKAKGDGRGGPAAAAGGGGSVEAKKRLKKKQKKKRQKANRKGSGTSVEAKGAHGKGSAEAVVPSALALSAAEQAKEMMMMEKASEPGKRLSDIALQAADEYRSESKSGNSRGESDSGSRGSSEHFNHGDKKSTVGDKQSKRYGGADGKKGSPSGSPGGSKGDNDSECRAEAKHASHARVESYGGGSVDDSMYDDGEDYNEEEEEGGTSASLRQQVSAYQEGANKPVDRDRESVCSKALATSCELSWLRPTLFAFLNFTTADESEESPPVPLSAPAITNGCDESMFLYHLQDDPSAEYLDSPFSAKISMVSVYTVLSEVSNLFFLSYS